MTRIAQNQTTRIILSEIEKQKSEVQRYSDEVSTGFKVRNPGDSTYLGTISQYQESLRKVTAFQGRVDSVESMLTFQENILGNVSDIMIHAKELATQGANETNSTEVRATIAREVFEMRDHLVALANSTYQGQYIYGAADDDDPPYDAATYVAPATGPASQRYVFDAELGTATTRSVQITDQLTVTVNTPGNQVFDNAIFALERLGRALSGYATNPAPPAAPDGTGAALTFPAGTTQQTDDILASIDLIDDARENDISPEQASVAGRLRRLETASIVLKTARSTAEELVDRLQKTDMADSASKLTQAQTALEASYTVNARVLNLSILDYL